MNTTASSRNHTGAKTRKNITLPFGFYSSSEKNNFLRKINNNLAKQIHIFPLEIHNFHGGVGRGKET